MTTLSQSQRSHDTFVRLNNTIYIEHYRKLGESRTVEDGESIVPRLVGDATDLVKGKIAYFTLFHGFRFHFRNEALVVLKDEPAGV